MSRQIGFFAKQPPHIQDIVLRMSEDHTVSDVLAHLKTLDIHPTPDQLGHFRRKHSKSSGRHPVTIPKDTFDERVWQYISAIPLHHGDTWSNLNLGFKGQIWARCATKLCNAMLIKQIGRRPTRYSALVKHRDMTNWYYEMIKT